MLASQSDIVLLNLADLPKDEFLLQIIQVDVAITAQLSQI